jgi:ubiquinone/menaquinone biosynthesis C-methylase UbiE
VTSYFQAHSSQWQDIYACGGAQAEIVRERHAAALTWIDSLAHAPGSHALEVGCGAGFLAVALAQRGFRVTAVDSSTAMVALARRHAAASGTADLLSPDVGDVHALHFADESFDLVIALGVLAWLEQPERALREMARVTRPGGHIIFTAANPAGLSSFFNPRLNRVIRPLALRVKDALVRSGRRAPSPSVTFHAQRLVDDALARAKLMKIIGTTVGFGPFKLLHREILPDPLATAVHHWLQRLARRGVPIIRSTGTEHLVLARKPMRAD